MESIQDIATHNPADDVNSFHVPAIVAVSVAFVVKLCLFLYCWGLRQYSQVHPTPPRGINVDKGPYSLGRPSK